MEKFEEREVVEFKKSLASLEDSLNSISAMLNKHKHGTIYFGVDDNGKVVGLKDLSNNAKREISKKIRTYIEPECFYEIETLKENDFEFIKLHFKGSMLPYSSKGKYFIRNHDENVKLSHYQLKELWKSSENENYSKWENELSNYTIEDLDEKLIFEKYKKGYELGRIKEPFISTQNVLTKFGLISNGKITNAGVVLFNKNYRVNCKLVRYSSSNGTKILNLKVASGNIFNCIEEAIEYVKNQMNWFVSINDIEREDTPEIPINIIRELILNSFIHSDYSNTAIENRIAIFPGYISIENPGHFQYGSTVEKILNNEIGPFKFNPSILMFLGKTGLVESEGYGLKSAYAEAKENNIVITNKLESNKVTFNIQRTLLLDKTTETEKIKLDENEVYVTEILKEDPDITAKKLSKKLKVSTKTIFRTFKSLKEKNIIKRIGSDKKGYWVVAI